MVDITNIDKIELLRALWENQSPAIFYAASGKIPPEFNLDEAVKAVTYRVDYFCGRAIKTNLSGNSIDPYLYDRDAGEGEFQKVVNMIRCPEQE